MESREPRVMALGACHAIFPWGMCDNAWEVNEHPRAAPVHFSKAVEDGVWQGAASALAVVHFRFLTWWTFVKWRRGSPGTLTTPTWHS